MISVVKILVSAVKGAVCGGIASFIGYAKQEKPEKWELGKAVKTVVLGSLTTAIVEGSGLSIPQLSAMISAYLTAQGIPLSPAQVELGITTGMIIVADQVVKIVVRRTDIVRVWNKLKAFLSKYWHK